MGNGVVPSPLLCLTQERYYVLYIRPSCIHRRKFDSKGNEIEPNFSATRKVNTGFLMSSYSRYPGLSLPKRLLDWFWLEHPPVGFLPAPHLLRECLCSTIAPGVRLVSPVLLFPEVWQDFPNLALGSIIVCGDGARSSAL